MVYRDDLAAAHYQIAVLSKEIKNLKEKLKSKKVINPQSSEEELLETILSSDPTAWKRSWWAHNGKREYNSFTYHNSIALFWHKKNVILKEIVFDKEIGDDGLRNFSYVGDLWVPTKRSHKKKLLAFFEYLNTQK